MKLWVLIAVAGIAIVAMSAIHFFDRPGRGDVAPAFELPSIRGGNVSLSEFRGKTVVLVFFATWCGTCREEFPSLNQLAQDYNDKGLVVLAVSEDSNLQDLRYFEGIYKPSFDILWDKNGAVADIYQSFSVPEALTIDINGVIRHRHAGFTDWGNRALIDEIIKAE